MNRPQFRLRYFALILSIAYCIGPVENSIAQNEPGDFEGLWSAVRNFPEGAAGTLEVLRSGDNWIARIGRIEVSFSSKSDDRIEFRLPNHQGYFRGRVDTSINEIAGHWIQPPTQRTFAPMASPLTLQLTNGVYIGQVIPLENTMSMFLLIEQTDAGNLTAVLRNPEANAGRFYTMNNLVVEENTVRFIDPEGREQLSGSYNHDWGQLSIYLPYNGGTYDFTRVSDSSVSDFFPVWDSLIYKYQIPVRSADGWETGHVDDVGIRSANISSLVELIRSEAMNSVDAPQTHALLIARKGKLVVEEYFHGYHGQKHHGTRSASKTITATLVGAGEHLGEVKRSDTVFASMEAAGYDAANNAEAVRMKLEHLITMASGFECNDWDNDSVGGEDRMQNQNEENDWYRYTLALPVVNEPGEVANYCSGGMNLAGGVISASTGEWLPDYFRNRLAEPLGINSYYMNLTPTGNGYGGGGIYIQPRDFMKLGQVFLDGGIWNGERVLDESWAKEATRAHHQIGDEGYGYGWWIFNYTVDGREIPAYYAGGNGGQYVIVVPEYDLVISFFGGNYSQRIQHRTKYEYVPEYILSSIVEE